MMYDVVETSLDSNSIRRAAGDCWQDGSRDGQNSGFNEDRNNECRDKGNQYYEAWLHGCENVDNTEDNCVCSTDS